MRELTWLAAEVGETLLQMQWHRIIDLGADALGQEVRPQRITVARADDVLIVDVPAARQRERCLDGSAAAGPREGAVIEGGIALPRRAPAVEVPQLDV